MPSRRATPQKVDFRKLTDFAQHPSGLIHDYVPHRKSAEGLSLTKRQLRARARRRMAKVDILNDQEMTYLYQKPIAEWDLEELAHGRPRNEKGHFKGPNPSWITASVHEEAMSKYTAAVKKNMRATTVDALGVMTEIINDKREDEKGRPIVGASTKLDAAKFLIEHVIGKPTQRIENDVSVKLQGILGQVMVNPADMATGNYMPAHYPGVTMELASGKALDDYETD